nr:MAG TPA: hypothetical protein [Caudoviricetes sp.]
MILETYQSYLRAEKIYSQRWTTSMFCLCGHK